MLVKRAVTWWTALYAAWWAFVGEWTWQDAAWGAAMATVATVGALVIRRIGLAGGHPRAAWLGALPAVPREVVIDLAVLAQVLWRALAAGDRTSQGRFVRRSTESAGKTNHARLLRAWLGLTATYSPNAYVVDIDADTGEALLHDLRQRRASEAPV